MRHPIKLTAHRKAKSLTQQGLADLIGVEQPTVQRWETGKRTPDLAQLGELADALGVEPGDLFKLPNQVALGPRLWLKGEVAAGVWKEAIEWPEESWQSFTGRADVTADIDHRFGLRVVGDSMNQVYPHGTIVECVSVFGRAEIMPGKRVVIVRQRASDLEYEATVKELREQDGKMWAVPLSTNPSFAAFCLNDEDPEIVHTRVAGIVVASVRPE